MQQQTLLNQWCLYNNRLFNKAINCHLWCSELLSLYIVFISLLAGRSLMNNLLIKGEIVGNRGGGGGGGGAKASFVSITFMSLL